MGDSKPIEPGELAELLGSYVFDFQSEARLQLGIAQALQAEGIPFEREVALSADSRIDFLLDGGIGIEVKHQGSVQALMRQLARYAGSPRVQSLLVIPSKLRLTGVPAIIGGKPLFCSPLLNSIF